MKTKSLKLEIPGNYLVGNNTVFVLIVSSDGEITRAIDFSGVNESISPKAAEFKKYVLSVAKKFNRPIVIADAWYEKVSKSHSNLPFDCIDTAFEWLHTKKTTTGEFKFEQTYPMSAARLNKFLANNKHSSWSNSKNKLT
jgi:hypothetical protein